MKKCRYCAELIRNEAVFCRYCGRQVAGYWRRWVIRALLISLSVALATSRPRELRL